MLVQLIHNGVVVPEAPEPQGVSLRIRGTVIALTPKQEEMAMAWARKKDTAYVQDPVFAANFLRDFSTALGIEPSLTLDEVDFGPCNDLVDAEREVKAALSKEERKVLAAERKAQREALKARYGYAIVKGQRVELGAYMTEPSGIFMGRGEHPLRGRWKEGATQRDVTLNLSPDAPRPEGDWGEIVWQPDSMWVARWMDKLSDKIKYLWLSDTAPIKQNREAQKFDKAARLARDLGLVRAHIQDGLTDPKPRRRMIATACYLIDTLCLRVGDEKEADEADTVGATTLRPEHVRIGDNGVVEFHFLGKDSVEWHKTIELPEVVLDNLRELIENARPSSGGRGNSADKPQLFPDVSSRDVNTYLSSIQPGLTAKVFRTHHATVAVQRCLTDSGVRTSAPEYQKWQAVSLANLEAAILCNHTKQVSTSWASSQARYRERISKAKERVDRAKIVLREANDALEAARQSAREREEATKSDAAAQRARETGRKRIERAKARIEAARQRRDKASIALGKVKAQAAVASKKRTWNLSTSLKSYIDPRTFHEWGKSVDYDVLSKYYPTILQRKFAWVRMMEGIEEEAIEDCEQITVRTCLSDDLPAVAKLFHTVASMAPASAAAFRLEPEDIAARYLPALEGPWREALIALDEREQAIGFVVVGPEWVDEEGDKLSLFALVHPADCEASAVRKLADEVQRRVLAHQAHNPKRDITLAPHDETWFNLAPELADALGLLPEVEDEVNLVDADDEANADDE